MQIMTSTKKYKHTHEHNSLVTKLMWSCSTKYWRYISK